MLRKCNEKHVYKLKYICRDNQTDYKENEGTVSPTSDNIPY